MSTDQTLVQLLPLIAPGLTDELVSATAMARLRSQLAQLPILSGGGFECPLGDRRDRVDLAMRVTESDGGFAFLADSRPADLNPDNGGQNNWRAICEFARSQTHGNLSDAVKEAWLEFDLDASTDRLVTPNFFFKLEPYFARPPLFAANADARLARTAAVINQCLSLLDIELSEAGRAMLEHCVTRMPASSQVSFVGAMLQRSRETYRLTLGNVPLSELTAYLHQIGWDYPHAPLIAIIEFIRGYGRSVALHLDVGERLLGKLGMEIWPESKEGGIGAWQRLLTQLADVRLCMPARVASILAWPDKMHRSSFNGTWPEGLLSEHNYFVRSINHIKLTYDPALSTDLASTQQPLIAQAANGTLSAKAYLAFNYSTVFPHPALWH